jgi:hypothetical protein
MGISTSKILSGREGELKNDEVLESSDAERLRLRTIVTPKTIAEIGWKYRAMERKNRRIEVEK